MAVKPEKIKERLKALWPKANLSQKRLDELAARLAKKPADDADDAAVDAVLNDANDYMAFEDIAKEDDRVRTLEAKAKGPADPLTDPPADPPKNDDAPAWAKDILESNKKLTEKVESLEKGKVTESKREAFKALFDNSEVLKKMKPEVKAAWLNRYDPNAETSAEDQLKGFETEFTDITQGLVDATEFSGRAPRGGADAKPAEKEVSEIVDGLM